MEHICKAARLTCETSSPVHFSCEMLKQAGREKVDALRQVDWSFKIINNSQLTLIPHDLLVAYPRVQKDGNLSGYCAFLKKFRYPYHGNAVVLEAFPQL